MSGTASSIVTDIESGLSTLATVVSAISPMVPGIGTAIALGAKVVQGLINLEPSAVTLYDSITSGAPVTAAQLATFNSAYELDYEQLNSDINTALATAASAAPPTPPGAA
jgi:hypothetical protein